MAQIWNVVYSKLLTFFLCFHSKLRGEGCNVLTVCSCSTHRLEKNLIHLHYIYFFYNTGEKAALSSWPCTRADVHKGLQEAMDLEAQVSCKNWQKQRMHSRISSPAWHWTPWCNTEAKVIMNTLLNRQRWEKKLGSCHAVSKRITNKWYVTGHVVTWFPGFRPHYASVVMQWEPAQHLHLLVDCVQAADVMTAGMQRVLHLCRLQVSVDAAPEVRWVFSSVQFLTVLWLWCCYCNIDIQHKLDQKWSGRDINQSSPRLSIQIDR